MFSLKLLYISSTEPCIRLSTNPKEEAQRMQVIGLQRCASCTGLDPGGTRARSSSPSRSKIAPQGRSCAAQCQRQSFDSLRYPQGQTPKRLDGSLDLASG